MLDGITHGDITQRNVLSVSPRRNDILNIKRFDTREAHNIHHRDLCGGGISHTITNHKNAYQAIWST
jgi:hypothetical protein